MKPHRLHLHLILVLLLGPVLPVAAEVPQIINYQGKITVSGAPFTGSGQFKFALVSGDGGTSYWSHDGTSASGSAPGSFISLPVVNGLYVVPLGDTAVGGMGAVPATVFSNSDVRLRVWFNDGTNGTALLSPDQRITSVGYAMVAATVPDGAITTEKLASGLKPKLEAQSAAAAAAGPTNVGEVFFNTTQKSLSVSDGSEWRRMGPLYDRQQAQNIPDTIFGTSVFPAFNDIPQMSLTTKNLGEPGTYVVRFRAMQGSTSGGFPQYAVKVNGNVVLPSRVFGTNGTWSEVTLQFILQNVASGSVIKMGVASNNPGGYVLLSTCQMVIEGVPESQVAQ